MNIQTTKVAELATLNEDSSMEEIKVQGQIFQRKTVESLVQFSHCAYLLKKKAAEEKEASFAELAHTFWGLNPSGASQAAKVGQYAHTFLEVSRALPVSARALYELAGIPSEVLETNIEQGIISPNMSSEDAKVLKLSLKAPKDETLPNPFEEKEINPLSNEDQEEVNKDVDPDAATVEGSYKEIHNSEPTAEKKPKMCLSRALSLLEIDVNSSYASALEVDTYPKELIDEAYHYLTGNQ